VGYHEVGEHEFRTLDRLGQVLQDSQVGDDQVVVDGTAGRDLGGFTAVQGNAHEGGLKVQGLEGVQEIPIGVITIIDIGVLPLAPAPPGLEGHIGISVGLQEQADRILLKKGIRLSVGGDRELVQVVHIEGGCQ